MNDKIGHQMLSFAKLLNLPTSTKYIEERKFVQVQTIRTFSTLNCTTFRVSSLHINFTASSGSFVTNGSCEEKGEGCSKYFTKKFHSPKFIWNLWNTHLPNGKANFKKHRKKSHTIVGDSEAYNNHDISKGKIIKQ